MSKRKNPRVLGFPVTEVTIVIGQGTDTIVLSVDGPPTFPGCGYPLTMRFEAQHGRGEQWVKDNVGVEPKIIKVEHSVIKRGG
jgi:hypothetical protein